MYVYTYVFFTYVCIHVCTVYECTALLRCCTSYTYVCMYMSLLIKVLCFIYIHMCIYIHVPNSHYLQKSSIELVTLFQNFVLYIHTYAYTCICVI